MAFGSKAGFFERILNRYARSVLALEDILVPGRPPHEALTDLLERGVLGDSQRPRVSYGSNRISTGRVRMTASVDSSPATRRRIGRTRLVGHG